tara:strand:+ start:316 stop:678 length:363 start_codon:yes stop_codon:yes gene_type:complete
MRSAPIADEVLRRLNHVIAVVPDLFWHEMRNVLMISYRRQRLSLEEVWRSMHRMEQLRITTSPVANNTLILTLAERHGLTAYDAAYLALAVEQNLPLATLDRKLSEAARREHVPLFAQAP